MYGYVLPDKGWDVEFNWKNKDEEYVINATDSTDKNGVLRVENARAKAQVSLFKTDAATKRAVEGAEFGIFTRHDIYNVDGEKIVDAGTMLGMVKTDADGRAISDLDFPLMSEGYAATGSAVETDKAEVPEPTPVATTPEPELAVPALAELINPLQPMKLAGMPELAEEADESDETDEAEETEEPDEPGESEAPDTEPEEHPAVKLNSGDYFLKELSVPGSYYADDKTEYPVHLEYKDQDTKVIAADEKAENTQTATTISKTAVTNSGELAGCDLQITDAEGNVIAKWTSGSAESIVLNDKLEAMGYRNVTAVPDEKGAVQINGLLHDTTYTLTETRPADGFVTAGSISFQLVEGENKQTLVAVVRDGKVTLQQDNIVRMVDDTTKVEISKTDITGEEEIPGCELEIKEKDTDTVLDAWTSTEEKHLIEQKFVAGKTYVLTEKRPADGYVTADSIEFTVEDTGEIQRVGMKDDTTKIRLIKLASDTGQGMRGAKFEVYDSQGKKVMSFRSKEDGYDITGKLAVGETYTFKEVEAPKGYRLAKPVKYTVKDTGEVQEISVTDKKIPKPKVPQTGGTTPFAVVAVLFFVLGSGGFIMARRKKKAA